MADIETTVAAIAAAPSWDARVGLLRRVPEEFGTAQHPAVFAAVARSVYVPTLAPDFAYVHWAGDYELQPLVVAYERADELTSGFTNVGIGDIAVTLEAEATTLRIFRLILGLTIPEFASATQLVAERLPLSSVGAGTIRAMEAGRRAQPAAARCCACVISQAMAGTLFPSPSGNVRSKLEKPDTAGWTTVREYASQGVPFPVLLHQRLYGGSFRQLLDATSTKRGDILEDAVQALFEEHSVAHVRTGSHSQEEIGLRFGVTVKPAPDFVVYDPATHAVEVILECKGANDGGTARDKAARFRTLRAEANRLRGVPVVAVLAGLGWTRVGDALGPVVHATDGRVFTLPVLDQMLSMQPFPRLVGGE